MVLLSLAYVPFTLALALLAALLAIEVLALLFGASLFGAGDGGPDVAPEFAALAESFDLDPVDVPDVGTLVQASDALQGLAQGGAEAAASAQVMSGLVGLGHTPFMIWFAALLLGFGIGGVALQSVATAGFGAPLPVAAACGLGLVAGLAFARGFARRFARLLPSFETTATSAQFMGGLRGVVSQGTASTGSPAEVRLRDRHGNIHYLRCEPFSAKEVIPEGAEVLTVRERLGAGRWGLRILLIE